MKNRRALWMMALAVVFGLAAVALASRWLLGQAPTAANRIVVAATDISLGQRRCVIDTVAHHRDRLTTAFEFSHDTGLVFWQYL